MKQLACVLAILAMSVSIARGRAAPIDVITTTEDLAALVREVGGDRVSVESLAKG